MTELCGYRADKLLCSWTLSIFTDFSLTHEKILYSPTDARVLEHPPPAFSPRHFRRTSPTVAFNCIWDQLLFLKHAHPYAVHVWWGGMCEIRCPPQGLWRSHMPRVCHWDMKAWTVLPRNATWLTPIRNGPVVKLLGFPCVRRTWSAHCIFDILHFWRDGN